LRQVSLLLAFILPLAADSLDDARAALQAKDPAKLIAAARSGLEHSDTAELHNLLGKGYAMSGDMDKAVPELESAVRLQQDNEAFHFDLAQLLFYKQDFAKAVTVLENASKRFPQSAQIELALGVAYYGQRRFEETIQTFLKTIDLAPEVPQPYIFLGKMLEHAGPHMSEITAKFGAWEKIDQTNAVAPLLHARALIAELPPSGWDDEAQEAQTLLEKSIALNSDSAEAYFEMGCLMDRKHEFPKAAELLEKSIAINAKDPVAHYRLARVYDRLGKKEQADAERALHAKLSEQEKQDLSRRAAGGMSR
jgi:tetratricopeptide (TPR) repeat protein